MSYTDWMAIFDGGLLHFCTWNIMSNQIVLKLQYQEKKRSPIDVNLCKKR